MAEPPAPAISRAVATGRLLADDGEHHAPRRWRLGARAGGERPDLQGDDHAERDRDEDHRQRGDLGDEPALVEELLPPATDC